MTRSSPPVYPARARASGERPVMVVGRGTLWAAGAAFALLATWGAGSAWYLLFRDQLAARILAQQTRMQYAYEAKVGTLRARLDRVASQKLLEQDGLEGRVADLMSRQAQLESRQTMLATLSAQASLAPAAVARGTKATARPAAEARVELEPPASSGPRASADPFAGALPGPWPGASPDLPGAARAYLPVQGKPMPAPETFGLRLRDSDPAPAPARPEAPEERPVSPSAQGPAPGADRQAALTGAMEQRLATVEQAMGLIEVGQLRELDALLQTARHEASRLRGAVAQVGLDPEAVQAPAKTAATGGPLVPLPIDPKAGPFERLVDEVQASVAQADRLRRVALALPLARPVPGEAETTSGFGYRLDPFTRSPALHTGLDFRAEHGSPVRAAAGGRVTAAEYSGGYGNMVELDHGNGVTSRYGHLSAIGVAEGQWVPAGATLGRVGSTGRSTGPHLHYETRINDEPVDPQRFLRAGARLMGER